MSEQEPENDIQIHVPPNLEYCYRDVANIYVGMGEVTIEFGNHHRSMPDHITIANRIVLSMANAFDLQRRLQAALQDAQQRVQEQLRRQGQGKPET